MWGHRERGVFVHGLFRINEAIRSLPEADDYPELTRNMLSVTARSYPEPGLYKYQMVHFGLSCWFGDLVRVLAYRRGRWTRIHGHGQDGVASQVPAMDGKLLRFV